MSIITYEKEPCGRCGGSGHYSYNSVTGTRCFGCGGSGERLTKRGRAAKAYADGLLDVDIAVFHDAHQGQVAVYRDLLAGRKVTFRHTVEVQGLKAKRVGEEGYRVIRCFDILLNGAASKFGLSQGIRVRLAPTEAQIADISAYQDRLTKTGKPRKGA